MSTRRGVPIGLSAVAVVLGLVLAGRAEARPSYFDVLTARYGITPSERTYACGNCHIKWDGTGARNSFGTAVEQQLYVGKSITQALADIEPMDADGDGFSNLDETATYRTLPGYACSDFFLADGAPIGYDTFITPFVPSCLEPMDIRVDPSSLSYITRAGTSEVRQILLINNGSSDPITVDSYAFVTTHPALAISGPATPFDIPVGGVVALDVTFAPSAAIIAVRTVRIGSNDPDEPTIDVPVNAFGFVQVLAAPAARARCLASVDEQFRRYADRHRREWNRCFLDEVRGVACDAGTRDLKIQQAATRFRDAIGGVKDKACAGANLTPALLGVPAACGGDCTLVVTDMASFARCLMCREEGARDAMLREALGTAPPDSPPNIAGTNDAKKCEKQIAARIAKGIASLQKILGRCEIANITGTPVECAAVHASAITTIRKQIDEALNRCKDATGLLGCLFEGGTEHCLGDAAAAIGSTLVDATFPDP